MADDNEERPQISGGRGGTLTPFVPGERLAGRAKGTPNKTARILKEAILMAAEAVGEPVITYGEDGQIIKRKRGKGGIDGYLRYIALYEPKAFTGLLGRVLPVTIKAEHYSEKKVFKTVDELRKELDDRGVPIDELLGAQSTKVVKFKREE